MYKMEVPEIKVRPEKLEELVVGDKVFKSAYDRQITQREEEKARAELGETEEKKQKGLQELKERLSKDSGVNYRTDDFYLLRFLRFRKYRIEEAYQNIKRFYALRKEKPDFFTIPSDLGVIQDLNFFTHLPYVDEEGRLILWNNMAAWKPRDRSFEEIAQSTCAFFDLMTTNPKCQINGVISLCDAKDLTLGEITEMVRKNRMKVFISLTQNGYPYRLHKGIMFNCNPIFRLANSIFRPLLRKKISDRIIILGSDVSELHKHINPALLPKRYGGLLDEEECKLTQHIMDNIPYLQYERSFS